MAHRKFTASPTADGPARPKYKVYKLKIHGEDRWRTPYYAYEPDGPITYRKPPLKAVRRFVTRDSKSWAERDANALATEYEQFRADYDREGVVWEGGPFLNFEQWRAHSKRMLTAEEIVRQANEQMAKTAFHSSDAASLVTVVDAALGMMSVGKRYGKDGKLRDPKESWKTRQQNYVRHLESSPFGAIPMAEMRYQPLRAWWQEWQQLHAPGTSARYRSWLITLGRYAQRAKYWGDNLFEGLPESALNQPLLPKRVWTFAEMDALWNACKNPQDQALLYLLRAGLRQCEAIALREKDCDFAANTISIRFNIGRKNNGGWQRGKVKLDPYMDIPKTDASLSTIKLPSEWMDKLRESLEHAVPCDIACVIPDEGTAQRFVVNNLFGEYYTDTASTKHMTRLVKRSNVPVAKGESTFHSWRYAFAADLVALGSNDIELMRLMRHADPDISKTTYASAREDKRCYEMCRQRIERLDDYLLALWAMDTARRAAGTDPAKTRDWPFQAGLLMAKATATKDGNLDLKALQAIAAAQHKSVMNMFLAVAAEEIRQGVVDPRIGDTPIRAFDADIIREQTGDEESIA